MSFEIKDWHGGKITEPGAYRGIPIDFYHGQCTDGVSVSSSGLRTIFIESLKHYWNTSYLNPEREEVIPTEPMVLGRAAHHLVLGEADFQSFFVRQPEELNGDKWNGNRKDCKAWLADRALERLTVITVKQIEAIKGMVKALAQEPIVQGGILNGHIECSLFWRDAETDIWLKSRPDSIPNDSGDAGDLKCTGSVDDDSLARGLADQGYHQQGALVREGFQEVLKLVLEHFTLIYVEAKKPHSVRFDEIAPEELDAGHRENHAALRLLRRAIDTGYWPGPKSIQGDGGYIRRPAYAANRAAQRLAAIESEFT